MSLLQALSHNFAKKHVQDVQGSIIYNCGKLKVTRKMGKLLHIHNKVLHHCKRNEVDLYALIYNITKSITNAITASYKKYDSIYFKYTHEDLGVYISVCIQII